MEQIKISFEKQKEERQAKLKSEFVEAPLGSRNHLLDCNTSLSTFAITPGIVPIFYNETGYGVSRLWFCFYYDSIESKYKMLTYSTERNESAWGVPLRKLLDASITVKRGSDFSDALGKFTEQQYSFYLENIKAMHIMIGNRSIKNFMLDAFSVLSRCAEHPSSVYVKNSRGYNDSRPKLLFKRQNIQTASIEYDSIQVPIQNRVTTATDVLGRGTLCQIGLYPSTEFPTAEIRLYDKYAVVGFDNINCLSVVLKLTKDYKLKHKVVDYSKRVIGNIKNSIKQKILA